MGKKKRTRKARSQALKADLARALDQEGIDALTATSKRGVSVVVRDRDDYMGANRVVDEVFDEFANRGDAKGLAVSVSPMN